MYVQYDCYDGDENDGYGDVPAMCHVPVYHVV